MSIMEQQCQDMSTPEAREAHYKSCWESAAEAGNKARALLHRAITEGISLTLQRDIQKLLEPFSITSPPKSGVNVRIGWMCRVWCDNYWEDEGVVSFPINKPPKEGEQLMLSDGKYYTVGSVNPEEMEIKVVSGLQEEVGCPCCGNDPERKVKGGGKCESCNGTGVVIESVEQGASFPSPCPTCTQL